MRILSVTAQRPDSTGSGVYLTELVRGFRRLGHRQAVLAGVGIADESPFPQDVAFFPVRYESETLPYPILGMSDEMPYRSTRYSDMTEEMTRQFRRSFVTELRRALKDFRPDVILCHHLYYLTALVRETCPDLPVFAICHGSDLRQIQKNAWSRSYILKLIPRLDGILSLHEAQRESIARIFDIPPAVITVVGTGYNSDVFYRQPQEERLRRDQRLHLLFAGKIAEKKGVLSLLRALQMLPQPENVLLELAGGYGSEDEYLRICRAAQEAPGEVRFLGKLSHEELAGAMNRSDIFVLPSFYEGLPLVLIEALACGMRAICTDLPGIRPWMDASIPCHGVVFVAPPVFLNQDEPTEESLPRFEAALARAVSEAAAAPKPDPAEVRKLSWEGLCFRLLPLLEKAIEIDS